MNRRDVLLGVVALLGGTDAAAKKRKHKRNHRKRKVRDAETPRAIIVEDYTGAMWRPFIPEVVENFRALGVSMAYEPKEERNCDDFSVDAFPRGRLMLCETRMPSYGAIAFIGRGRIHFNNNPNIGITPAFQDNAVCHEMMHILAEVPDNYGSDPESCVWGYRNDPGSTDIRLLTEQGWI